MKKYDVVVIGCGAAGIGAAYALKESGKKVLIIDKFSEIGGTHLNAWVNVHAVTPPPPFLKAIIGDMIAGGNANYVNSKYEVKSGFDYLDTYLNKVYTGKDSACISFNIEKMRERYRKDLSNIDFMLNTSFSNINEYEDGKLYSIKVSTIMPIGVNDKVYTVDEDIEADMFIDCSANNVLIRAVETKYFNSKGLTITGLDRHDRFGFDEIHNSNKDTTDWPYVNDPTLMYRIEKGSENIELALTKMPNYALVYKEPGIAGNNGFWYVNTVDFLNEEGCCAVANEMKVYKNLVPKTKQHWITMKEENPDVVKPYDLKSKRYASPAPVLGLRETYRTICERMLSANDLCTSITLQSLRKENMDSVIAIGNHPVDIHSNSARSYIDMNALKDKVVPYAVSYGSLIPLYLKNVLVASRGAGFTHIAAASFRLNKNMMQLGWVAGKASTLFEDDFRNVDSKKLQKLIGIEDTLKIVICLMHSHHKEL